jgi:hypothetical protein
VLEELWESTTGTAWNDTWTGCWQVADRECESRALQYVRILLYLAQAVTHRQQMIDRWLAQKARLGKLKITDKLVFADYQRHGVPLDVVAPFGSYHYVRNQSQEAVDPHGVVLGDHKMYGYIEDAH